MILVNLLITRDVAETPIVIRTEVFTPTATFGYTRRAEIGVDEDASLYTNMLSELDNEVPENAVV